MISLHVAHAIFFGFFHPPSRWRDLLLARCLADKPEARPSAAELGHALTELADSLQTPPLDQVARVALSTRAHHRLDEANAPTTPHRAVRDPE
jgi:hypothetical protein